MKMYHNDLIYMTTKKISAIIDDPHLPISDKERFIICSLYGIKNHPQMSALEISKIYGEGKISIRRRCQRAFVSIFKYQNGEIPAKIDYEADILPLMRYFSKYDRMLIEDYFKKGLSYEKMAKIYKLTMNQIVSKFNRIILDLYDMINNPKETYFDYDFFDKAICDPLLPFYGNLDEAVKMFNMRFAHSQVRNMSGNEIARELKINMSEKTVILIIQNLIMAVCKYKKGIRKEHLYTYDDVLDYYERHKEEMPPSKQKIYLMYFKRRLKETANRNRELITKVILRDIIKERAGDFQDTDNLDHDKVVELVSKKQFSSRVLKGLLNRIGETERVTMNGQDLNHVYRLLHRLYKTIDLGNNKALVLDSKKEIFSE